MHNLWTTVLYNPLYNALIALISFIPGHDVGLAVILLTIIVKLILFPLTKKSIVSQAKLKKIEPLVNQLKIYYPNKEEQAKKTLELYKQYKVNPFSGCLVVLIQLPIIFALYYVFFRGLNFNPDSLYHFIKFPEIMHMNFLGLIPMQGKSLVLALLAGVTQFIQMKFATAKLPDPKANPNSSSFNSAFQKSMNIQMRYVLPVLITFIAYKVSAAVALYWVTSNIFTIVQELLVRRSMKKAELAVVK